MTITKKALANIKLHQGHVAGPLTGISHFRKTAQPSWKARMRAKGIVSGIDMLLSGYVDQVRGVTVFPLKGANS